MKKTAMKLCSMLLLLGIMLGELPHVKAQERIVISANYEYQILDEAAKTAVLLKVRNYGETLTIPSKIDGYRIVQIGMYNKEDREKYIAECGILGHEGAIVKKIVIPEGVYGISKFAFYSTPNLEQLTIPKSVYWMRQMNFNDATKIKALILPGSIDIRGAFEDSVFDKVIMYGDVSGYHDDDIDGAGMDGDIKELVMKGKGKQELSCICNISTLTIDKSVKKADLSAVASIETVKVKNKKTKVYVNDIDVLIRKEIIFHMGVKKKNKKGNYSWSKPYVKIWQWREPDELKTKKKYTYELRYKNKKGRWKIKKTSKTHIKGLKTKSSIQVTAKVKIITPEK